MCVCVCVCVHTFVCVCATCVRVCVCVYVCLFDQHANESKIKYFAHKIKYTHEYSHKYVACRVCERIYIYYIHIYVYYIYSYIPLGIKDWALSFALGNGGQETCFYVCGLVNSRGHPAMCMCVCVFVCVCV